MKNNLPANTPIEHPTSQEFRELKSGAMISSKRFDAYRSDGWVNILTGLGLGSDKKTAGQLVYSRLVEVDVETIYAGDDMGARIVDLLPDNAMRKGWDFQGLDTKTEQAMIDKCTEIEVKKKVSQQLKWGRLYGGAGLLVGTDEMGELTEPMPDEVDTILSLTLCTRYELYPSQLQYNPLKKNFGYPEFYRLQLRGTSDINGGEVHHSRIVRAEGVELPRRLHIQNQYWGDSVLSRVYEVLRAFSTTHASLATVMQDFRVGIFKLKNLAEMIAMGEDGLVQKRLALVDAAKSVARSIVIDAEGEDFQQATGNLTGVKELIEAVNDRFVAATGIPITVLLGRSPQGLGGSGRHEETNWYDMVASYQEDTVRPILKSIFEKILRSKNGPTNGKIPEGFGFTFNPLWQLDETEQATNRYTQAQADEKYIVNGVVTPEEIAISRFGGEKWDHNTKIDLKMRQEVKPQGDQPATGETPTNAPPINSQKDTPNIETPVTGVPGMNLTETGQVSPESGPAATRSSRMPNDDEDDPEENEDGGPGSGPSGGSGPKTSEEHEAHVASTSAAVKSAEKSMNRATNAADKTPDHAGKEATRQAKIAEYTKAISAHEVALKGHIEHLKSKMGKHDHADADQQPQTIMISKTVAKNMSQARKMAQAHTDGQDIQTADETSTAYKFKVRPASDFMAGTMKAQTPTAGVSVIKGDLKK